MSHIDTLDDDLAALIEVRKIRTELEEKHKDSESSSEDEDEKAVDKKDTHHSAKTADELQQQHRDKWHSELEQVRQQLLTAIDKDDVKRLEVALEVAASHNLDLCGIVHHQKELKTLKVSLLYHAIDSGRVNTSRHLIDTMSNSALLHESDVEVMKVETRMTCLHLLVIRGHLQLAPPFLVRLRAMPAADVHRYLSLTVLHPVEGQRPRNMSSFHLAALYGRTELIEPLCSMGVDVNSTNNKGDTAALLATRFNNVDTMRALLALGANVRIANDKGSSPLYWAVRYGYTDMTRLLIDEGKANVSHRRLLGLMEPIVLAAALGRTDILRQLLEAGANVHTRITRGLTALHHAAVEGHAECARLLLQHGANVNAVDSARNTPLLHAVRRRCIATVRVLVTSGADMECSNRHGDTMWDYAVVAKNYVFMRRLLTVYRRANGMMRRPLSFPISKTPLHVAASIGDIECLRLLMRLDANVQARDQYGNSVFHLVAVDNRAEMLSELLSIEDLSRTHNLNGDTPLHLACRHGSLEVVDLLLTRNPGLTCKNNAGETPLHVAAKSHDASAALVRRIVDAVIKTETWSLLDEPDRCGQTALHVAVRHERFEAVPELFQLNPCIPNGDGHTALHVAAHMRDRRMVALLLHIFGEASKSLDMNQLDGEGRTLLHICADVGLASPVKDVIQMGADLLRPDAKRDTVLHLLAARMTDNPANMDNYVAVFQALVDRAAVWWCAYNDVICPEFDTDVYREYTRTAVLILTRKVKNADGLSVIAYATTICSTELVTAIFNLNDIYCFRGGLTPNDVIYDVTWLTPETLVTNDIENSVSSFDMKGAKYKLSLTDSQRSNIREQLQLTELEFERNKQESLLAIIVDMKDELKASRVLDIMPIAKLVEGYYSGYRWLYLFLLAVHTSYMICFSNFSINLLHSSMDARHTSTAAVVKARDPSANDDLTLNSYDSKIIYILAVYPAQLFIIAVYLIIARSRLRVVNLHKLIGKKPVSYIVRRIVDAFSGYWMTWASLILVGAFCAWAVAHERRLDAEPQLLAFALLIGWLFTVSFTKGFQTVHSLSIMLRLIIVRDIARIAFVFAFVLLGFAYSIFALFQAVPAMATLYPSVLSTVFLLFNLLVALGWLFDDQVYLMYEEAGESLVWLQIIYVAYIITANLIFINILIAVMLDTYGDTVKSEGTTWRVGSLRQALDINSAFPCLSWCFGSIRHSSRLQRSDDQTRWILCIPAAEIMKYTAAGATLGNAVVTFDDVNKQLTRLDGKMTFIAHSIDKVTSPVMRSSSQLQQTSDSEGEDDEKTRDAHHVFQSRRSTSAALYRCGNFAT